MTARYSTIVIGAGAIGSATAYWLAKRGQRDVLVLEQFALGHAHGASNDHHRIIRHSYHDDAYGGLTRAMYDNWAALEEAAGQRVFVRTGGLDIAVEGTPGTESLERYRGVMDANDVRYETLDRAELLARFPQWRIPEERVRATYQEETGFIDIRRATATHIALAQGLGVEVRERTPARAIESFEAGAEGPGSAAGVRVRTDAGTLVADRVVVCAASWTDELLRPLGQSWRTTITEEQVVYVRPRELKPFSIGEFPVWVWHGEDFTYGFPTYGEVAVKLARENLSRVVTQDTRSAIPHADETAWLLAFLRERLPAAAGEVVLEKTCPYDMTPDRDFILDAMPGHPNVIVGSGAAHAGKFCGLLGEILSELVVSGRSQYPIDAFRADRPALTDPSIPPVFNLRG
ncbi:N-methyl-L-tryptophan oxidase [Leucobacter allii]|uniref:N-methyl-L-tryptophan oxidase n=1 Tax=Leucobacter allii TaxID=2932247 RepID=A0ABY4FLP1_9MICO|nr:N-methyl-L-tryptophan oxidase [Leucobacter allii]UOQ57185.1 N-methyl-L-tryptophan oxidase [Leucobacter allii]